MGHEKERKQIMKELKLVSEIEDKYRDLGKLIMICWKDKKPHNFDLLIEEYDRDIKELQSKLKREVKHGRTN